MPSLIQLSEYIYTDDPKGFLKIYLELLVEGYTLSIPKKLTPNEVKEAWQQIIPRINKNPSGTFIDQLSKEWLELVKKQGGTVTDYFAKELLAILQGEEHHISLQPDPLPSVIPKPGGKVLTDAEPTPAQVNRPKSDPNMVESSISSGYYEYQTAQKTNLIPKEELQKLIAEALKNKDAESFLICHLSNARHGVKPKVPLSSVPGLIKSKWEEILLTEFNAQPGDVFLENLSKQWFYWVNQKGLPSTNEAILEVLYGVVAQYKAGQKKGTLFSKLFKK